MQLDDGPLEEQEIAFILQQVLRALVYVHAQQRVHRDIKAANVLLSVAGAVKISDFGVSGQMTGKMLPCICTGLRCEHRSAVDDYKGRGSPAYAVLLSLFALRAICKLFVLTLHQMAADVIVVSLKALTAGC